MSFEFSKQDEYNILTLKGDCLGTEKIQVDVEFEKFYKGTGLKFLVVQCETCGEIGLPFLRALGLIYKKLKDAQGKICLINASTHIRESIEKAGMDRLLPTKDNLKAALVDFGIAKSQKDFDVNFINPFINAAQKVLGVQCQVEATPQKAYLKKATDPLLLGDISGLIGIVSETFNGTLAISFPQAVFLQIATGMLGEKYTEITNDIVDLAGELSNIILGQAKIDLNSLGFKIQQAIPSCVWGKDHQIKHFGGGACIVVPYETRFGVFHVEIISNNTSPPPAAKAT